MGLPVSEAGGPGGGGMGLPDDEAGLGRPGAGALGRGGPPAGGRGAPGGGAAGRPVGGGVGRGARGAGRSGARGASVGAADAAGTSSRRGGGGRSLPDDVTSRPGGGGGAGRPAVRWGGAAGGDDGRGFHPSEDPPAAGRAGSCVLGRDGASGAGAGASARAATGSGAAGAGASAGPAVEGVSTAGAGASAGASAGAFAAFFVLLAAFVALVALTGLGSSGCSARVRPSRSARRRTRSACASSMPEECVFTPMPRSRDRSRVSLFVIPSSLASSWIRIFAAKVVSDQPFILLGGAIRARGGADHGPPSSRSPRPGHEHRLRNTCGSVPTGPSSTLAERSWERPATDGERPTGVDRGPAEPRAATSKCTALDRSSIRTTDEADQVGLARRAPAADAGALRLARPGSATARPARHRRARPPRPRSRPLRRSL